MAETQLNPLLNLEGITLQRQGKNVIRNFSLKIFPKEHWIILGPNGCGKSSLLSLLQGLLWPQKGSVTVLGKKFAQDDITEIRRVTGLVGAELETKFMQGESALAVVQSGAVGTLGLKFESLTLDQKKEVNSLVKEMRIQSLVHKSFYKLSQGEKRSISIARALMTHPELLLLDEACAGLDPVAREEFLQRLKYLGQLKQGPVILAATHHVEEIRNPFTHCLLMSAGSVFAAGKIPDVLNSHNLSHLFGRDLHLSKSKGRYQLQLK